MVTKYPKSDPRSQIYIPTATTFEAARYLREQSNAEAPFLTLPPEIRNRIYALCSPREIPSICRFTRLEILKSVWSARRLTVKTINVNITRYFTTLPALAIEAIDRIIFDVPISDKIFDRPDCRIIVVIDRDDEFVPYKIQFKFREDPGHFQGGLKGEFPLASTYHRLCHNILDAMRLEDPKEGVKKDGLLYLMGVLSMIGSL